MNSKQLINHLCYEYSTKNYNEEKLKATQEIKKYLEILDILNKNLYYDNKNHVIKMKEIRKSTRNFDYEDLKEWINDSNKYKSVNSKS